MSHFTFTVPGQPMSWNRSYRQRKMYVKDRFGNLVYGPDGKPKMRMGMFKTEEAETYQDTVRWLAKTARPTDFTPAQVIIAYDFILARDIDCDNVMKMIHDALAEAIQLDDRHFFPVVLSKTSGSKDPHVIVNVYDRSEWEIGVHPR